MKQKAQLILGIFMALTLIFSSGLPAPSYATQATTSSAKVYLDANLKNALNQEVPDLLDKKQQHLSATYSSYEFTPTEADFATNKWQKYISAVYVYATDVSFIITTGYVDGRIEQKTSFDSSEVEKALADAKTNNEVIRDAAISAPDNNFKAFYETVYQQKLIKLYTGEFISLKTLSGYNLSVKAPELQNKLMADYNIYKKGNFYLVTWSEYPSFNQHSLVSSSVNVINKQLQDLEAANNTLLIDAKLMAKPAVNTAVKPKPATPSFTVISLYPDKTYTIMKFASKAEADKYASAQVKIVGKGNVKTVSSQAEIDKLVKNLKLKTPKK